MGHFHTATAKELTLRIFELSLCEQRLSENKTKDMKTIILESAIEWIKINPD